MDNWERLPAAVVAVFMITQNSKRLISGQLKFAARLASGAVWLILWQLSPWRI